MATRLDYPQSATVTDARQLRSRAALTSALLSLLDERPFDQLTIREIAARAGIGYATFFRHFQTKEALLADLASAEISGLLDMTMPILTADNSLASTRALCAHVAAHRKLWTALLTGGAAGIVRAEFIRLARGLPKPGQGDNWLPADLAVVYGTGGPFDLLAWWLSSEADIVAQQIAGILHRLIIAPLVGDAYRG